MLSFQVPRTWANALQPHGMRAMDESGDFGVRVILPVYISLAILATISLDALVRARSRAWGLVAAIATAAWLAAAGTVCHPYLSCFNGFAAKNPAAAPVDFKCWSSRSRCRSRPKDAVRRLYGLPRIKRIVSAASPPDGWSVVSLTIARTLNLPIRPWSDRIPPAEKVGTLWLYDIPRTE